ncbi:MAG: TerB family tellurite resistance protein [Burkholderiaceae bacterium]|nr:TerB family tellurite resistance protein [Burkholderiaceae bacterium]
MTEQATPFDGVKQVVGDALKFKGKLAIGENAYASLRHANAVRRYWDLIGAVGGGAAVAKSGLVAAALGAASTPVGWVVAAAVVSGGAWYGVMHLLNGASGDRVTVIPKFINTPIDLLAISLFDLMLPLALKLAAIDGRIKADERRCIQDHFIDDWGYDRQFVKIGCKHIEQGLETVTMRELAKQLAEFLQTNPDCNPQTMTRELLDFLRAVAEADGPLDEREELALEKVAAVFDEARPSLLKDSLTTVGATLSTTLDKGSAAVASGASALGTAARAGADVFVKSGALDRLKIGAAAAQELASRGASAAATQSTQAAQALLKRLKKRP